MAYVPALAFRALTPLYDPLARWTLREDVWRTQLVAQMHLEAGQRVLDLGCGTATLALLIKQACPGATVLGVDGDSDILATARRKVSSAGAAIGLIESMAWEPPLAPGSIDRVVSSLVLHHLSTADKHRTLAAARAVLRPGGELHLADWGEPHGLLERLAFLGIQLFDGFETTDDNARGLLMPFMWEAGFVDVEETHRVSTAVGPIALYRAVNPGMRAALSPACEPSSD